MSLTIQNNSNVFTSGLGFMSRPVTYLLISSCQYSLQQQIHFVASDLEQFFEITRIEEILKYTDELINKGNNNVSSIQYLQIGSIKKIIISQIDQIIFKLDNPKDILSDNLILNDLLVECLKLLVSIQNIFRGNHHNKQIGDQNKQGNYFRTLNLMLKIFEVAEPQAWELSFNYMELILPLDFEKNIDKNKRISDLVKQLQRVIKFFSQMRLIVYENSTAIKESLFQMLQIDSKNVPEDLFDSVSAESPSIVKNQESQILFSSPQEQVVKLKLSSIRKNLLNMAEKNKITPHSWFRTIIHSKFIGIILLKQPEPLQLTLKLQIQETLITKFLQPKVVEQDFEQLKSLNQYFQKISSKTLRLQEKLLSQIWKLNSQNSEITFLISKSFSNLIKFIHKENTQLINSDFLQQLINFIEVQREGFNVQNFQLFILHFAINFPQIQIQIFEKSFHRLLQAVVKEVINNYQIFQISQFYQRNSLSGIFAAIQGHLGGDPQSVNTILELLEIISELFKQIQRKNQQHSLRGKCSFLLFIFQNLLDCLPEEQSQALYAEIFLSQLQTVSYKNSEFLIYLGDPSNYLSNLITQNAKLNDSLFKFDLEKFSNQLSNFIINLLNSHQQFRTKLDSCANFPYNLNQKQILEEVLKQEENCAHSYFQNNLKINIFGEGSGQQLQYINDIMDTIESEVVVNLDKSSQIFLNYLNQISNQATIHVFKDRDISSYPENLKEAIKSQLSQGECQLLNQSNCINKVPSHVSQACRFLQIQFNHDLVFNNFKQLSEGLRLLVLKAKEEINTELQRFQQVEISVKENLQGILEGQDAVIQFLESRIKCSSFSNLFRYISLELIRNSHLLNPQDTSLQNYLSQVTASLWDNLSFLEDFLQIALNILSLHQKVLQSFGRYESKQMNVHSSTLELLSILGSVYPFSFQRKIFYQLAENFIKSHLDWIITITQDNQDSEYLISFIAKIREVIPTSLEERITAFRDISYLSRQIRSEAANIAQNNMNAAHDDKALAEFFKYQIPFFNSTPAAELKTKFLSWLGQESQESQSRRNEWAQPDLFSLKEFKKVDNELKILTRKDNLKNEYNLYDQIKNKYSKDEPIILDPFLFDYSCQVRAIWIMLNFSGINRNSISEEKMRAVQQLFYLSRLSWYQRDQYYSTIECGLDPDLEQFYQQKYNIKSNSDTITRQLCYKILSDLRNQIEYLDDVDRDIKSDYLNQYSGDWVFKRDHQFQPFVQNFVSVKGFADIVRNNQFPVILILRHDYISSTKKTSVFKFAFRGLQILEKIQDFNTDPEDFVICIETRSVYVQGAQNENTNFQYSFYQQKCSSDVEKKFQKEIQLQNALLCLGANHEQFLTSSTGQNNNIYSVKNIRQSKDAAPTPPRITQTMKGLIQKYKTQSKRYGVNYYDWRKISLQNIKINIPLQFIHIWATKIQILDQELKTFCD